MFVFMACYTVDAISIIYLLGMKNETVKLLCYLNLVYIVFILLCKQTI